jgi:ATP-dependent RNA helicase RhlE|nr:C-terminal helicase domain-containing protein [Candidatus Kapabacteria bacterium]
LANELEGSVLVFTRTKRGADRVSRDLQRAGFRADALHGDKSQDARQRALRAFKNRQTRVLVATDIAARGIDVSQLPYVINFDVPESPETYVHRIGRTGRAGIEGVAITLASLDERNDVRDIERTIRTSIPRVTDHPFAVEEPQPMRRPTNGRPGNSSMDRRGGGGGGRRRGSFAPRRRSH